MRAVQSNSEHTWQLCIEHGDLDGAYEILGKDGEAYCQHRSTGCSAVPAAMRGRGTVRTKTSKVLPPSSSEEGAATSRLLQLQKWTRRLEELGRKLFLRGEQGRTSEDAGAVWEAVRKGHSLAPNSMQEALHDTEVPNLERTMVLVRLARELVKQAHSDNQERRSETWHSITSEAWAGNRSRMYAYCKEEEHRQLHVLSHPDGRLTGQISEMHEILHSYWKDVFQLYTSVPEPSWNRFWERYQAHLPRAVHMQHQPLTPERLRATLAKMNPNSSFGADGWRVRELRLMPTPWLQRLCLFLETVERRGEWPKALLHGTISPIPKETGTGPSQTRPITVMSTIYRLWAGTRVQELIEWQAHWIGDEQFSYRPEWGCHDAWWTQALSIEHALLSGEDIAGLSLDWAKAFDRLPKDILLQLARATGMESGILRALEAAYTNLQRHYKVGHGFISEGFVSTNGILQGCPISVILLNLFVRVWLNLAHNETTPEMGVRPRAYADDMIALARTSAGIRRVLQLTLEFAVLTGMKLNVPKCGVWATCSQLRQELAGVHVEEEKFP